MKTLASSQCLTATRHFHQVSNTLSVLLLNLVPSQSLLYQLHGSQLVQGILQILHDGLNHLQDPGLFDRCQFLHGYPM